MHIQSTPTSSSDLLVKTKADKMRFETKAADGSKSYSLFESDDQQFTM